jgi:Uma2 family endonuclease
MNILHKPPTTGLPPAQRFVLSAVPWASYEKILDALSEHHVRITYDRGDLELISPLPIHERYKIQFGRILTMLAEELDIPVAALGSTTFRREDLERGLGPDECYYLSSAALVQDWRELDLSRDPPPDLAVEIENTTSCLNRMSIYANLGVPEVWRFDGDTLEAYRLIAGPDYEAVTTSPGLPFLPLAEIVPLVQQAVGGGDDRPALRAMRAWVRQRVAPLYRAWGGTAPPPPAP